MSARALLTARLLAVFSLVAELGIHLFLLPDHLRAMPYMGWLFVASAVIISAVLVGLNAAGAARSASYGIGVVVCSVMFGGFVASRTIGLPMGYREGWLADDALGIPSLAFEVIFIACAALVLWPSSDHQPLELVGGGARRLEREAPRRAPSAPWGPEPRSTDGRCRQRHQKGAMARRQAKAHQ
ncbi:MAG TPA: hypothetical protein VFI30_02705 [Nocardioidaceae bacterium]|nr:hypothetical protein [Nocardioidaceae bacterium]